MKLEVFEIPRQKGQLQGKYRLTMTDGRSEKYPGARFVDGVTVEPVEGKTVKRLYAAFGPSLTIEAWDDETLSMVADTLRDRGEIDRAAELTSSPAARSEATTRPELPAAEGDDLDIMSRAELMDEARELGLSPHWNTGSARLKELIRDHRDRHQATD